ncbi:two-component sensor histidine kinase [Pseudomonas sp. S10E 269]|uniref:sensor histidine kinase n=1 Tax=unclassified Pseudomonas TaxID=196821 RepID=UPI000C25E745|nr:MULTISPECIES: ATP-binding protein [unclassified Pseudomonas]PJK36608.1 two-component sensor histidine kinase [Pseudomonas sp. S09F 262]PJK40554.1 two-component sensor histidine kinase [Pseudomonas sp. S10E 269]
MSLRPRDTVARWIALTILIAMITALAFNALFVQLAGVWARPPLTETGLLEKIAVVVRVVEASEPSHRSRLARAVGDDGFNVTWAAQRQALGLPVLDDPDFHSGEQVFKHLLQGPPRSMEAYEPSDWPDGNGHYALLVQLADRSWLMFSASSRSWGLDDGARSLIVVLLVLISTALVTLVATRRLARPLQHFALGARRFGADFRAPPIEPMGPHELRQAILAFNSMQAQLRHFIQDRTQMLAAISHDLRAPLTRLRLRGEFIEDADQQQRLFRDVDEMQAMINTALEFFRDDARLEQATQLDLAELLQTLIDDYRDQSIDLTFRGPPRLVYFGRPLGLKRVMTNLMDNAIHYGVAPEVELQQRSGEVVIRVLDRGPGIAAEHREQVFLPFYRLEGSRNKSTGGVGLGLSTARAIVLEHGGTLTLTERQGGGLEAVVVLPV